MKFRILLPAFLLGLLLAGCGEKPDAQSAFAYPADYSYGEELSVSRRLSESENGFYYLDISRTSPRRTLRYCDKKTGKDIILCNKPECRHDGSEFCVAANGKYDYFAMQLYEGNLYILASCAGDGAVEFKLLRAALDGSDLSELVTVCSYASPDCTAGDANRMLIHRGKAALQFSVRQNPDLDDISLSGAAIYDLKTQQLDYVYETPLDAGNPEWDHLTACEDYLFYTAMEGRRRLLHRRHLLEGMDEALSLRNGFRGYYVATDQDTVYYTVNGIHFCVYHIGERTGKILDLTWQKEPVIPQQCYFDGKYLYFPFYSAGPKGEEQDLSEYDDTVIIRASDNAAGDFSDITFQAHVLVYTPQLEPVAKISSLPDYRELTGKDYLLEEPQKFYGMEFHFMGDTVYLTSNPFNPFIGDYVVYAISREDLLSGERTFQPLFNP